MLRGQLSIWGASIMRAYERVAVIALVPSIAWVVPRDCLVLGSRVFSKMSKQDANSAHLVMNAKDTIRLIRMPIFVSCDQKSKSGWGRAM